MSQLLQTKSVEDTLASTQQQGKSLKRTLGVWDLMVLGIAVAIGAGIYSVGATIAANYAGPAVLLSFILAAITCGLSILCYAEFASTLPVAGSAYTYTYASMGEFLAWIIGWNLILELFSASAVISKYWGVYLAQGLGSLGLTGLEKPLEIHLGFTTLNFDWKPVIIIALFTILLAFGTKLSTRVGNVFTLIKVLVTVVIIIGGFAYFNASNLEPFIPPAQATDTIDTANIGEQSLFATITGAGASHFGVLGIVSGASLAFFAFIGFDVVATTAEEAKDPQRTVIRGIFGGLIVVTALYLLVSLSMVGMVSYKYLPKGQPDASAIKEIGTTNPGIEQHLTSLSPTELSQIQQTPPNLTKGFQIVGADSFFIGLINFGIVIGLTTVVMVLLMGLSRVFLAMSRDGLLPRWFSKTSDKTHTPVRILLFGGISVTLVASLVDVSFLEDMITIGTLSAFFLVSIGVIVLRYKQPNLKRGFKVPFFPVLPIISALACFYLMLNLSNTAWRNFIVWLVLGTLIYLCYGYWHSDLHKLAKKQGVATGDGKVSTAEADNNLARIFSGKPQNPHVETTSEVAEKTSEQNKDSTSLQKSTHREDSSDEPKATVNQKTEHIAAEPQSDEESIIVEDIIIDDLDNDNR